MPFTISINTDKPFSSQIDEVERAIYQKPARFFAEQGSSVLRIHFQENNDVTSGYMHQIAATIRILYLNADQMLKVIGSDWQPLNQHMTAFNHMVCAYDPASYSPRGPLGRDMSAFFRQYRSSDDNYAYINNSVPWVLLINQSRLTLLRLRLEFTLIDMLGRRYLNGNGSWRIFRGFFLHHSETDYQDALQTFFAQHIIPLRTSEQGRPNNALSGPFNSLRNVIDTVLSDQRFPEEIEKVARVVYLLRCRYFHGNMTASYPVDPIGHGFIEEMERICHTLIMAAERELFDYFIELCHD